MAYMRKQHEARRHPESILNNVRSVIMVGMEYAGISDFGFRISDSLPVSSSDNSSIRNPKSEIRNGKIARYAAGPDYHEGMWQKLDKLLAWLRAETPNCHGRAVVDTAPLL